MSDDGSFAREMSRWPDLYRAVLADHRPDAYGRCLGCRSGGTLAPRHPCSLARVAEEARTIAESSSRDD